MNSIPNARLVRPSANAAGRAEPTVRNAAPHLRAIGEGEGAAHPIRLTPRQRDVLALLCQGLPNKLISRGLNISAATVKVHISSILRELGVTSRLQAVVAARQHGLLDTPVAANDVRAHGIEEPDVMLSMLLERNVEPSRYARS